MRHVRLTATGRCVPTTEVTNDDLRRVFDARFPE